MNGQRTQDQLLTELVEAFKADSGRYRTLGTPRGREEKRRLLRSLMNVRMPGPLAAETEAMQDEYLRRRLR